MSHAISFLKRAEQDSDPINFFRDAWSSVYNLFTQHGRPGDEEYKMLDLWVTSLQDAPSVRRIFEDHAGQAGFSSFLSRISAVKKTILRANGERALAAWKPGVTSSVKACRYFFNILQDIRNRVSHPDYNPSGSKVLNALASAAECLIPISIAAIEILIEHPVEGTTGRTIIKRFFLYPYLKNIDSFFSDYYLERLFPNDELESFPEEQAAIQVKDLRRSVGHSHKRQADPSPFEANGT